jgi:hypothetical protein
MKSLSKPATARIRSLCLHSGCSQLRILRTGPHGMGTPHCSVSVQACLPILYNIQLTNLDPQEGSCAKSFQNLSFLFRFADQGRKPFEKHVS